MKTLNIPNLTKLFFILIISVGSVVSCSQSKRLDRNTFNVGLPELPQKFRPRNNDVNIYDYINTHLYFPMFSRNDEGKLESHFFDLNDTMAVNESFTKYKLCLLRDVAFSDGTLITVEDLINSIQDIHRVLENLPKIISPLDGNDVRSDKICVQYELERPDSLYFDKLTSVRSTILKSSASEQDIPIGIGPYRVISNDNAQIKMEGLSRYVDSDFKYIIFHTIYNVEQARRLNLDDWNHIYIFQPPEDIVRRMQSIRRILLKTYYFMIDYNDESMRRRIRSCLNVNEISKYFNYSTDGTKAYLPSGMSGHDLGFELEKIYKNDPICKKNNQLMTIKFICSGDSMCLSIKKFVNEKQSSLPFKLRVEEVAPDKFDEQLYGQNEIVTFLSSGAVSLNSVDFFSLWYAEDSKRINNVSQNYLVSLMKQASFLNDSREKTEMFKEAHKRLLNSGYVLPIGQVHVEQFYPSDITNLKVLNISHGFPQINLFKIKD